MKYRLMGKQKGKCYYCGEDMVFCDSHVDHKIPKAKGGISHEDNYCLACQNCNIVKSDMPIDRYIFLSDLYKKKIIDRSGVKLMKKMLFEWDIDGRKIKEGNKGVMILLSLYSKKYRGENHL